MHYCVVCSPGLGEGALVSFRIVRSVAYGTREDPKPRGQMIHGCTLAGVATKKPSPDSDWAPDQGWAGSGSGVGLGAVGAQKPTPDFDPDPPRTLPGFGALSGSGVGFLMAI